MTLMQTLRTSVALFRKAQYLDIVLPVVCKGSPQFISAWQNNVQKYPSKSVFRKRCSENMQQIYKRTPMPKCDFNKVALHCNFIEITLRRGCSPVNVLHMFRIPFLKNTSGRLLLNVCRRHESFLWAYGIKKIVFFI